MSVPAPGSSFWLAASFGHASAKRFSFIRATSVVGRATGARELLRLRAARSRSERDGEATAASRTAARHGLRSFIASIEAGRQSRIAGVKASLVGLDGRLRGVTRGVRRRGRGRPRGDAARGRRRAATAVHGRGGALRRRRRRIPGATGGGTGASVPAPRSAGASRPWRSGGSVRSRSDHEPECESAATAPELSTPTAIVPMRAATAADARTAAWRSRSARHGDARS